MAAVSIIKATYSDPDMQTLLAPFGGMEKFVKKNEKVLLKVNLLSSKGPDKAVTTHPEFVRAVANAVRKADAEPFIGDSPAGTFSKRSLTRAYGRSGLENLAGEEQIPLNFNTSVRTLDIPKDAVKVKGRIAKVNYSRCIRCFCCHEVCPEDAIVLRNVKLI
jgi:uncharacterized protein (DUF362 family)